MADRFEELRTYVTVVEAGGVNAAAANLGIAKSAISRRLSELEARLGVTLVERTTRRFELTDTGRSFYRDSRRLLDELDASEKRIRGADAEGEALILSVDAEIAAYLLAEPVASFLRLRPGTTVTLIAGGAEDREADIVIRTGAAGGGRALAEYQLVVAASPAYLAEHGEPASPADLARHLSVVTTGSADRWAFRTGMVARPLVRLAMPDVPGALAACVAGAGLAQLPRHVCAGAIRDGTLRAVMPGHEAPPRTIIAVIGQGASALADHFVDHLAATLRA